MMLTTSNILMIGLIVLIGFGISLHLNVLDKGDLYQIQNIVSHAIVKSQNGMIQSAFMSEDANGLISHATVGFGLGSVLIDPDGSAENNKEYFDNKVTECVFHSDEDIDEPICVVCKLVNEKIEPCEDIFLDFIEFPDGTTQDDLNLGLATSGITITGKANAGFTGANNLFVWDVDVEHSSAQGPTQDDNDIESPEGVGDSDGYCDGCDGWHILVFPDNDGTGNPDFMDDSELGGTITITFDTPVYFAKFDIADIENDNNAKAIAYSKAKSATECDKTTEIKTVPIPKVSNDGDVDTVVVDANNVGCLEIKWEDSGGPTNFDFRCIKQKLDPDSVLTHGIFDLPDGYDGSTPISFPFEEPGDIFETMGVRVGIFKSVIDFEELSHGDEHDVIEDFLMDNFGIDLEVIDFDDDELESIMYDSENMIPTSADKDLEQPLSPFPNDIGKLLVIKEDGSGSGNQPNDRGAGGIIRFKSVEPNTYISMDHVDHEPGTDDESEVRFHKSFDCSDADPAIVDIPATEAGNCSEDCHWNTVEFGEAGEDVQCMEIFYPDSGGFTNFILGCVKHDGRGCSPGYWKVTQHHDSWMDFSTDDIVGDVFEDANTTAEKTLLEALNFMGGSGTAGAERILLRAAVAGVLNGAHPEVNYPIPVNDLIEQVNAAIATGDRDTMLDLADIIDHLNNLNCPLNGDISSPFNFG